MEKINKKKQIKKIIYSCIFFVIAISFVFFVFHKLGLTNITQEELQKFISSTGVIAPFIYIVVCFFQVILLPIPTTIVILVGNYLFNPGLTFIYSYIGIVAGSITAYYLGKLIGRPFVNWLSGDKEQTEMWMSKLKGKENILLFFMFLFPIFPDDVLCAIAGILPISSIAFILMQLFTRITTIGGTLLFMSGEFIPYNGWGISIIIIGVILCIIAFIICFKNAEKINLFFKKHVLKK